jgi:hypothetical protein
MSEQVRVVVERMISKYLLQFDGKEINIREETCPIKKLQSIIELDFLIVIKYVQKLN